VEPVRSPKVLKSRRKKKSLDSAGPEASYAALPPQETTVLWYVVRFLLLGSCFFTVGGIILAWVPEYRISREDLFCLIGMGVLSFLYASHVAFRLHFDRMSLRLRYLGEINELNGAVIMAFAKAMDARDQHTHGHVERVQDIVAALSQEMALDGSETEALKTAAILHDMGKLAVPDYILSKPQGLTEEEMRKVQTHTVVGAAILSSIRFPWPVVPIVRSHHEWFDGTGYPDGLRGQDIPLGARILSVADVFDALLSSRPYRAAYSTQEALSIIKQRTGTQFDTEVVDVLFRWLASQQKPVSSERGAQESPSAPELPRPSRTPAAYEHIARANRELLALYDIARSMGTSLSVEETMNLVIGKTKRIVRFATCIIFIADHSRYEISAVAADGLMADQLVGTRMALGEGISGQVALAGRPAQVNSEAAQDICHLLATKEPTPLTWALVVPLLLDGAVLGTISLYETQERSFSADEARLLSMLADQVAIAINNARTYEETSRSAVTDGLTGLYNSRYFFLRLERELNQARYDQQRLSLIALDVDGLKFVNDTFGHQLGDLLLKDFASILVTHTRDADTVVRYGGDEFFIIFPSTTKSDAEAFMMRIKEAVSKHSLPLTRKVTFQMSVSAGVSTFPTDGGHPDELIAVADAAMLADKRSRKSETSRPRSAPVAEAPA
jgi:diguanylate cyclase (GGDEF)-like protein/putative nucleotidyltransferase with HDIG domain